MGRVVITATLLVMCTSGGSAVACVDDVECDDQNLCTSDSCTEANVCANTPVLNGSSCSDGNLCNGAETCLNGECYPGYPLNVNDSNPCTIDGCNPITGATHEIVPDDTPCPDADTCDGEETCQGGSCTEGTPNCSPECASPDNLDCPTTIPLLSIRCFFRACSRWQWAGLSSAGQSLYEQSRAGSAELHTRVPFLAETTARFCSSPLRFRRASSFGALSVLVR